MSIDLEKEKIRKAMRQKLKAQTETERLDKSRQIADKILNFDPFQKAQTVMFYSATDEEVLTRGLMKEAQKKGKRILLPFIDQKVRQMHPSLLEDLEHDLVCGSYGIMEPKLEKRKKIELNEIGLALVPGLAFDRTGNRLGRGQGYYDRFLSLLPKQVKCVGLAFDFQVLDQIPVSDSDIRLDLIVTNDSNYGND